MKEQPNMTHDIPDNQITKGFTEKPENTTMTQVISRKCFHEDGAIKVAEYIVDEIKKNSKSNQAKRIRKILADVSIGFQNSFFDFPETSNELYSKVVDEVLAFVNNPIQQAAEKIKFTDAMVLWAERVNTRQPWDHKPIIREKFRADAVHRLSFEDNHSESYDHKYKGYDYFLDIWSNIHYGYVGLSVGFTKKVLLGGSDIQQKFMSIFTRFSRREGLTEGGDSIDDIMSIKLGFRLYEEFGEYAEDLTASYLLDILASMGEREFPRSKRVHVCWDSESPDCYKQKEGCK